MFERLKFGSKLGLYGDGFGSEFIHTRAYALDHQASPVPVGPRFPRIGIEPDARFTFGKPSCIRVVSSNPLILFPHA
jgi:hypothetical protein